VAPRGAGGFSAGPQHVGRRIAPGLGRNLGRRDRLGGQYHLLFGRRRARLVIEHRQPAQQQADQAHGHARPHPQLPAAVFVAHGLHLGGFPLFVHAPSSARASAHTSSASATEIPQ
jgi:hypothetical protein